MATLHIRNVPADLFEEVQRWANEHGRSINAEIIDLVREESARRREAREFERRLAAYRKKYAGQPVQSNVVALIRDDRDQGHKPEFGY